MFAVKNSSFLGPVVKYNDGLVGPCFASEGNNPRTEHAVYSTSRVAKFLVSLPSVKRRDVFSEWPLGWASCPKNLWGWILTRDSWSRSCSDGGLVRLL